MLIQALTNYYGNLTANGVLPRYGWSDVPISWGIEVDDKGNIVSVLPLKTVGAEGGKKERPTSLSLPAPVKRSSSFVANFLWDNASYILGMNLKTKNATNRAPECFEEFARFHKEMLSDVDSPAARAVVAFVSNWMPGKESSLPEDLQEAFSKFKTPDNFLLFYNGAPVSDDEAIADVWQKLFTAEDDKEGDFVCLVTGKHVRPALIHPNIKVPGCREAQSSGVALVSYNAAASCSYGLDRCENAPMSHYVAFAYTSALNYLLSDRRHRQDLGKTILLYWAEGGKPEFQDLMSLLLNPNNQSISDDDLHRLMENLVAGEPVEFEGTTIQPRNQFYILGVTVAAARMAVQFFYESSFAELISRVKRHYDDINIVPLSSKDDRRFISVRSLVRETINKKSSDAEPIPGLQEGTIMSILNGARYPATLATQALIRSVMEGDINRAKIAIFKSFLLRNSGNEEYKEVATVSLNPDSKNPAYTLGRLFATLESVQYAANPNINATIKDLFFTSASMSPAGIFNQLLNLADAHLASMSDGHAIYWEKQIADLMDRFGEEGFPKQLGQRDQMIFKIGYYHQRVAIMTKKCKKNEPCEGKKTNEENKEENT